MLHLKQTDKGFILAKCRNCRSDYTKTTSFQTWCSPDCAIKIAQKKKEKQIAEYRRDAKRADRERKDKSKTKGDLMKEAQVFFNRFIRLRDAGKPCISCGRMHQGQIHAGHYISVGAAIELRFNENNCHAQCAPCNNHLSGNPIKYRVGLIDKVGFDVVEFLEGPHPIPNWSKDDIREIKKKYQLKCKELLLNNS